MSQHHLSNTVAKTGEALRVCVGYDRPLNYFFVSISPMDEETYRDRTDLVYESMYHEPTGGFPSISQVIDKLNAYGIEAPRGLALVLEKDKFIEWQNFQDGIIKNTITYWPLEAAKQRELDLRMDQRIVMSVLANDEESSDAEVVDVIVESVVAITREQVEVIVAGERSQFFVDMFHEIDFDDYLEGDNADE